MIDILIRVIIFLVAAPILGGLLDGLDRIISARMQGRIGPPLLQPFYDVSKLFQKQTIAVSKSQSLLIQMFFFTQIFTGCLFMAGFDIMLCFFILSTGATFLVFAGAVTHSPYSSMGASRELLQMLSYEPAILMTCLGFYLAAGTFKVEELVLSDYSLIVYLPGFFVAYVFSLTIKMRKSPFDLSTSHHPHQELVKGITTEIGSRNLAFYFITEWYENIFLLGVVALFIINKNPWSILAAVIVVLLICFLETLIDNTSARMKWDKMLTLTWIVTLVSAGTNLLVLMLIK